jgi:NAD(P)-dependent dehydrogenase (short-subunit alcohol dehydrogenase family)
MPSDTDKKVALVTGANKGLGLETARQLGRLGFRVLMAARDAAKGKPAVDQLRGEGLDVEFIQLDVADERHRADAARHIGERYGRLDVLVNNAGVALEQGHKVTTVPLDVVRDVFETNFFALVAVTQAMLPLVRKSPAGRIVNLSSILGSLQTNATQDLGDFASVGYNASKAAVNMYTVLLAKELAGTPAKVNAAHPGWVKTDMGGAGAQLELADGAKTSVWLATLGPDGPTGGYFHMQDRLPW